LALIVAGISYRTAPVEVRERLVVPAEAISELIAPLRESGLLREAVLLSTCNRTELYCVEGDQEAAAGIFAALSARLGADAKAYGYVRRDREAAAHLFRVAAGIDSMILGEAQIQGQVRDAWEASRQLSGTALNRLFQSALGVAGKIRHETGISRGAASVSSAAVQLSRQIFGSLNGRRAMVLGAGEMAELALECLMQEGVRAAIVANRTHERAEALARLHGATAIHYDECWAQLHEVDVLISSTSAPHAVVTDAHVKPSLSRRSGKPLCILDIALPRDVEATVGKLDNVFLYDLDDLRSVVATNLEKREQELPSAESRIAAEVERYWEWLAGLEAVPVLTEVRAEMERLRERELAAALRRMPDMTPQQQAAVEHLSRSLMNKFLHEPSVRLRTAAANGRGLAVVDAARYLFGVVPASAQQPTADQPTAHQPAAQKPAAQKPADTANGDVARVSDTGADSATSPATSPATRPGGASE
jgi:glutamyl-tRNA reductase